MADAKKETKTYLLPVGRLINASLFEKDAYTDPQTQKEGTPSYKLELAFDPKDVQGDDNRTADIEEAILDELTEKWGAKAADDYLDGKITGPFIDGDKLAERRKEKGKDGGAYAGKKVARANTIYNKDGADGPGGIQVWDENVKPVTIANGSAVYPGCYGQAAVTIHCYLDNRGDKCVKFYLSAFQKTGDGEKLAAAKDTSSLFKPVGKPAGEASKDTGRRRRG